MDLGQVAAGAEFLARRVDHPDTHPEMIGQRFPRPDLRVDRQPESLAQMRHQRLRQTFTPAGQPVALRHLHRHGLCGFRQRHKRPAQFLRQTLQIEFHLVRQMTRHGPVECLGREILRLPHAHLERHAVFRLARTIGVGERQRGIFQGQRLRERRPVRLRRLRIAQVIRLHQQESRLRALPLPHEVDQLGDGGNAGDSPSAVRLLPTAFRQRHQSRRVEPVGRLVEVEVAAITGPGEIGFHRGTHAAVVLQKIKRPCDRVVHQALPDEELGRVHRIDPPVAHGAAVDLEPVQPRALAHHDPALGLVPERFAVGHPHKVRPELERPSRIEPGAGAGVEPGGLGDLGRHDPAGSARLRRGAGRVGFLLRVVALVQRRAGEEVHPAVVGRLVAAILLVEARDVAEQAGEDAVMDRAVAGGAKEEFLARRGIRFHAVEDRGHPEPLALLERVKELAVDVAPLTNPGVAQEMIPAEAAKARL